MERCTYRWLNNRVLSLSFIVLLRKKHVPAILRQCAHDYYCSKKWRKWWELTIEVKTPDGHFILIFFYFLPSAWRYKSNGIGRPRRSDNNIYKGKKTTFLSSHFVVVYLLKFLHGHPTVGIDLFQHKAVFHCTGIRLQNTWISLDFAFVDKFDTGYKLSIHLPNIFQPVFNVKW